MAIWCLFSQCLNEPSFHGYTTSKKKAIEWMKDEMESLGITCEIRDNGNHLLGFDSDDDDATNSVEAVRLEKI